LSIYGFQRITSGADKNAYYHEHFLRGHSDLTRRIERIAVKGTGNRRRACPSNEPDFHSLPYILDHVNHSQTEAIADNGNTTFASAIQRPITNTVHSNPLGDNQYYSQSSLPVNHLPSIRNLETALNYSVNGDMYLPSATIAGIPSFFENTLLLDALLNRNLPTTRTITGQGLSWQTPHSNANLAELLRLRNFHHFPSTTNLNNAVNFDMYGNTQYAAREASFLEVNSSINRQSLLDPLMNSNRLSLNAYDSPLQALLHQANYNQGTEQYSLDSVLDILLPR
jgi:hypothetical protein